MDFFSLTTVMMLVLIFVLGAAVGAFISRMANSDQSKSRALEKELDQLQHDHDIFRQSVTDHFNKTANLVRGLTENYVEVYKHLSEGASKLANNPELQNQLQQPKSTLLAADQAFHSDEVLAEQPRDYASDVSSPDDEDDETPETKGAA